MDTFEQITHAVTLDDVMAARDRIRGFVRNTPVLSSRLFDERAGLQTFFKCENLQRGGAFKIRGALNFLAQLTSEERRRGVIAYSSGNHAQAVAMAAAHLELSATIVMPADAPKAKLEPTRAYGPKIVFYNRERESREDIAASIARETGAVTVPPYDHPWIIAGQGTAALELLEEKPDLEALAVPLGGGGLLSGTLIAAKAIRPGIRVYGVEPDLADDWHRSLGQGHRVRIQNPATIADGLRSPMPGEITFPIVRELADGVLLVSEDEIKETMRFLLSRTKALTEPSGAAAAAAVLNRKMARGLSSAGVLLSGGNVDFGVLAEICNEAA